jgi:putative oxidoreductase
MTPTLDQGSVSAPRSGKVLGIASWVVQILAGGMLLMAGIGKLRGTPEMVGAFEHIGAGQWFRYLTGALEVVGAILLVVPRTIAFGAALLGAVMLGAVATHLFIVGGSPLAALILLAAVGFVAWVRRAQLQAVVRRVLG